MYYMFYFSCKFFLKFYNLYFVRCCIEFKLGKIKKIFLVVKVMFYRKGLFLEYNNMNILVIYYVRLEWV